MARTPKRAGRVARPGSHFLSEIVARNVRSYRALRGYKQEDVAEALEQLGHAWSANTVGFVERCDRTVAVDELAGLAVVLHVSIAQLLDPYGPQHSLDTSVDLGGDAVVPPSVARRFVGDLEPDPERARLVAGLAGLSGTTPADDGES